MYKNREVFDKAIENLKKSFNTFIKDDELRVLVVKGRWGVGKTFQWNKFVNSKVDYGQKSESLDQHNDDTIKLGDKFIAYSYVSLFGKKKISEIRQLIFSDAVSLIDTEELKKAYQEKTKRSYIKKSFKSIIEQYGSSEEKLTFIQKQIARVITADGGLYFYLKKIFPKFNDILSDVENLLTNNFLVCIDDLERKNNQLSVSEVMGMVDEMVNKKECKVILLFNDSKLKDDEEKNNKLYSIYKEKLVDLEIQYDPSFEYNFELIFEGFDEKNRKVIFEMVQKLDIKNIRILKKIHWLIKQFWNQVNMARDEVVAEFLSNATFLCWAYFTHDNQKFKEYRDLLLMPGHMKIQKLIDESIEKEPCDHEKKIQLANIGASVFNVFIIDCLNFGYCGDISKLNSIIRERNEDIKRDQVNKELSKIWELYSDTFDDNLDEFKSQLKIFFDKNMEYVYALDLDAMLDFIDEDDHEHFINKFLDIHKLNDVNEYTSFVMRLKNQAFKGEILDKVRKSKLMTIGDAISDYKKGSWSKSQIEYLKIVTVDQLVQWMKSNPDELVAKIRSGLLTFNENDPELGVIRKNTVKALLKIAAESNYNAKRVYYLYNLKSDNL